MLRLLLLVLLGPVVAELFLPQYKLHRFGVGQTHHGVVGAVFLPLPLVLPLAPLLGGQAKGSSTRVRPSVHDEEK